MRAGHSAEDQGQLVATPPLETIEAVVVVPVRDEAATLPATLNALASQLDLSGRRLGPERYEIILLANNCEDASASVAREWARCHPRTLLHIIERTLAPPDAHIGHVRRLLMDDACARLEAVGRRRGIIVSTDSDSTVHPTWLAATLLEVRRGADAVGGRILVHPPNERRDRADDSWHYHLRDVGYRLLAAAYESCLDPDPADPRPRHHQHFGASMAVTPEAYRRAGGLPPEPALEDMAFERALRRVDTRLRHSPLVCVTTSARSTGRTPIGLATQLAEWDVMARERAPYLVESAPAIAARVRAHRDLRAHWLSARSGGRHSGPTVDLLADRLGLSARWLGDLMTQSADDRSPFGALDELVSEGQHIDGQWAARWPRVDVIAAIASLRQVVSLRGMVSPRLSASSGALEEIETVARRTTAAPMIDIVNGAGQKSIVDVVTG